MNDTPGHAFISYVREDKARVKRLQEILQGAGIRVWRDTADLWPGQDWKSEIRRAIRSNSLAFISCFSEHSQRRSTSYQNEELLLAVEQMRLRGPGQTWLIPVRFADCDIPDFDLGAGRTLDSLQRVDLFGGKWEQGTGRLIASILRTLGTSSESIQDRSSGPWRFEDDDSIVVVCGELPSEMRAPFTERSHPDYDEIYKYADLGSLVELYGHLRAMNPTSRVDLFVPDRLMPSDYAAHLVSLGGPNTNAATRDLLNELRLPVRQVADWGSSEEVFFEVLEETTRGKRYLPTFEGDPGSYTANKLRYDVALFARAVNPFNRKHSVTICTGMYAGGTYGVVRALTDPAFRDRNAEYLVGRFEDHRAFCILTRVYIGSGGVALTPDWTSADHVLFEWPEGD